MSYDFKNLPNTCAIIDKEAFKSNINLLWDRVGRKRKMLVAVKADAYGHGAVEISRICAELGVSWLGVAQVNEGIALRNAGINTDILKFSPIFENELLSAIDNKISFVVCSFEELDFITNILKDYPDKKAAVHIKVDTGMGRIGINAQDSLKLYKKLIENQAFNLQGIMTHLPVSDSSSTEYTKAQLRLFKNLTDEMLSLDHHHYSSLPIVHAANSAGILAHSESWFDMVRPGIAAYGTYPSKEVEKSVELKEVMTFKSRVSFVKKVKKGTGISYGHIWKAPEDTYIATIPVGYADGYNRLLSNQGNVVINNRIYPIAGRVCMDQFMVNLGNNSDVARGDHVILFGYDKDVSISQQQMADQLNTITYEITCRVDKRVPRVYV